MRKLLFFVSLSLVFLSVSFAAVPQTINYQGHLASSGGTPINAAVDMTFTIYNAATNGTNLWTEDQTVQVNNGIYAVALGAVNPIDPAVIDGDLWLGVKVGTDSEMTPRQKLNSVPFSVKASDSDTLQGYTASQFDQSAHVTQSNIHQLRYTDSEAVSALIAANLVPSQPCNGLNLALQWDGSAYVCTDLRTLTLSGGQAKGFESIDRWGYAWDGVMRSPLSWSEAEAQCTDLGGRLPTATELYRVSVSGTGDLGDSNSTNYLWSRIQYGSSTNPASFHVFRLSDGTSTTASATTAYNYRCVWPNHAIVSFSGDNCYGPAGDSCWADVSEGGRYNIDKYDRPPLPMGSAMRECAFSKGQIPTELMLAENIQKGLPNGSGDWLQTSDHQGYNGADFLSGAVRWTNTDTDFTDASPTYATWGYIKNSSPFRCAGINSDISPYEGLINDEWSDPEKTRLKSTANDQPSTSYYSGLDACLESGGHLPSQQDLGLMIQAGLPNGSHPDSVWTSDAEGGVNTGIVRWTGSEPGFDDTWSTFVTWANRGTGSINLRCAYYPLDTSYAGPSAEACTGGCYLNEVTNDSVVSKTWTDQFDRPKSSYDQAIRTCASSGGHLASHRDMAELIRNGLSNGSNQWLWTSDLANESTTTMVRWSGIATTWNEPENDISDLERNNPATLQPYRCVWTNELRR